MILQSMIGVRYAERGNLDSLRSYPFSEAGIPMGADGARLPTDVFLDAAFYPVVRDPGPVTLASVDFASGTAVARCGILELSGVYSLDTGTVEFHDPRGRHAGTMVCGPGWKRLCDAGSRIEFTDGGLRLAPSACMPVICRGVEGFAADDGGWAVSTRDMVFAGRGGIEPMLSGAGCGSALRFDAHPAKPAAQTGAVRQIVFATVGRSVFSMGEVDDSTVLLAARGFDREDVCWQAHREDSVSTVTDTCEDPSPGCQPADLPYEETTHEVCPSDSGAISIVADDLVNQKNPFRVTVVQGSESRVPPKISKGMSQREMAIEASGLMDLPAMVGNGVRIEMTGIGDGR